MARKRPTPKRTSVKRSAKKGASSSRPPAIDHPRNPTGAAIGSTTRSGYQGASQNSGIPNPYEYVSHQARRRDRFNPNARPGGTVAARPGQSSSRWPGSEAGTPWRHERIGRPTPSRYYRDGGTPLPPTPPPNPTGTPDVAPPATPVVGKPPKVTG